MASNKPVTPNFKDVDKEAAKRAEQALQGGRITPLTPPKSAKSNEDSKGRSYTRWTESVTITQAYRSVTKKGLLDVTVVGKIRQSSVKENTGKTVFAHFYLNMGSDLSDGHVAMNDRSNGAIISLLKATGFMPQGGSLRGSLLDKMFPPKNQPGTASPLNGKAVVGNVVQQYAPANDAKGEPVLDDEGEAIWEKRDQVESFLPEADPEAGDDEGGEDEGDEDEGDEEGEGEPEPTKPTTAKVNKVPAKGATKKGK